MKDQALQAARAAGPHKLAVLREFLQAEILFALQNRNAFQSMAFVGGTALRFLFGLGRYSEDLDFSATQKKFDPEPLWKSVSVDLQDAGYKVGEYARKKRTDHAVSGVFYRFDGLLNEVGLTHQKTEKLAIRVEVDLRPPAGATLQTTLVRRHLLISLCHYDMASLFAGKCHAVLQRQYTNGRDLYDLVWYLSQKALTPNLILLNHVLEQTGWKGPQADESNWRALLSERVEAMDWKNVASELETFLENPKEARSIDKIAILSLLAGG